MLADYVFKAMADASVDDVTFARLKTNLEKSYRNLALHHRSGNRALQLFHAVCKPIHFDPEQRLTELKSERAIKVYLAVLVNA